MVNKKVNFCTGFEIPCLHISGFNTFMQDLSAFFLFCTFCFPRFYSVLNSLFLISIDTVYLILKMPEVFTCMLLWVLLVVPPESKINESLHHEICKMR